MFERIALLNLIWTLDELQNLVCNDQKKFGENRNQNQKFFVTETDSKTWRAIRNLLLKLGMWPETRTKNLACIRIQNQTWYDQKPEPKTWHGTRNQNKNQKLFLTKLQWTTFQIQVYAMRLNSMIFPQIQKKRALFRVFFYPLEVRMGRVDY